MANRLKHLDTVCDKILRTECINLFLVSYMSFYFSSRPLRHRVHHDSLRSGVWALHPCGSCQGRWLPLGLEGHHAHLAVLFGLDWSSSTGMEPLHAGSPSVRLLPRLDLQRSQWRLLHSLIPPRMLLCPRGCHGLLLWKHLVHCENGKTNRCNNGLSS